MKKIRPIILIVLVFGLCFAFGCSDNSESGVGDIHTVDNIITGSDGSEDSVKVSFDIENYGTFTVETYPKYAPQSVARFLELVNSGYYDGSEFISLYPGNKMISSHDTVNSAGEYKDTLVGEFMANGYSNELKITRGTLGFCYLPGEYDTAKAQFMIALKDSPELDGYVAGFARVSEGTEIFNKLAAAPINADNTPVSPIVMKKVYIDD